MIGFKINLSKLNFFFKVLGSDNMMLNCCEWHMEFDLTHFVG